MHIHILILNIFYFLKYTNLLSYSGKKKKDLIKHIGNESSWDFI
jgi:hypothetical protein